MARFRQFSKLLFILHLACTHVYAIESQAVLGQSYDETSLHVHEYWMRHANTLYASLTPSHTPCPFNAFAAVIVNHSAPATEEFPFGVP
jgi:hypothetical protein